MSHFESPHLSWPFSFSGSHEGTSVGVVEQDSGDDIALCVEAVLRYQPGIRMLNPGFGITDQTFRRDVNLDEISEAVATYEPRAAAAIEDASQDLLEAESIDDATRVVRIALGAS